MNAQALHRCLGDKLRDQFHACMELLIENNRFLQVNDIYKDSAPRKFSEDII